MCIINFKSINDFPKTQSKPKMQVRGTLAAKIRTQTYTKYSPFVIIIIDP